MQEILLIVYLVVSILLIGIILIQQGKGAVMGASFGAGGANTVFGSAGAGNVLTKTTTILAVLFFATALAISYFNAQPTAETDAVLDAVPTTEALKAPAAKEDELEGEVAPTTGTTELEGEVAPTAEKAVDAAKAAEKATTGAAEKVEKAVEEKAATEDKQPKKKDDTNN